jgi:hypothetical protein
MRLSEERIADISEEVVEELIKSGAAELKKSKGLFINEVIKLIKEDLRVEEEIEEEANKELETYSRKIIEGSPEWRILFQKTKEKIAKERNYIL